MVEGIEMKSRTVWLRLEVEHQGWNRARSPRAGTGNDHHTNDPLDMTEAVGFQFCIREGCFITANKARTRGNVIKRGVGVVRYQELNDVAALLRLHLKAVLFFLLLFTCSRIKMGEGHRGKKKCHTKTRRGKKSRYN
jgi:hypothetical protein